MISIIYAQCFGMLTQQMLAGGLLLLYFNALGTAPARILALLSTIPLLTALFSIPVGWIAERVGVKVFGFWGILLMALGMAALASAGSFRGRGAEAVTAMMGAGLVLHTLGLVFFNSGWFALLSHIVPAHYTGRFFSILRSAWQIVAIAFFAVSWLFFTKRTPVGVYQIILAFGAFCLGMRAVFYRHIPGVPGNERRRENFGASLADAFGRPRFTRYLAYLFLVFCVTGNAADMLRLSAARGSGFGDNQVLLMSVAGMVGSLLGFAVTGKLIDRLGTARIFLACHVGFCAALALFPARHLLPFPWPVLGVVTAGLLGMVSAAMGIAAITQSFVLIVGMHRNVALALVAGFQTLGAGLAGYALAGTISRLGANGGGFFAASGLNPFDVMLLALSGIILILIAAHRILLANRP